MAELQAITYNQYLPALLGPTAITPYTGYNPAVNTGITPEFSEAAYRFGHSQLDNEVQFLNNDGTNFSFTFTQPDGTQVAVNTPADIASGNTGLPLLDVFFDPNILEQPGVESAILKYLGSDIAQAVDTKMVDDVRNVLFRAQGSGAGGQDLFALDIQRGRDVGLPTYNAARVAYGLPAATSFSQITSDPTLQTELQQLYGTVDNVELFVGGLAEDHAPGSSMGSTFQAIIANQFERIRDGDSAWYQQTFSGGQLQQLQATTLSDIIRKNTTVSNIANNAFIYFDGTATATLNQATGTSAALTLQSATNGSDPSVIYTWTTIGSPPSPVTFTDNGDNSAQGTIASFSLPGTYDFQVTLTNPAGLNVSTSVSVTVTQTAPVVTTSDSSDSYTAGAAALPVDPGVTLNDNNASPSLSATVAITGGYQDTDTLNFTSQNGITGTYSAGVLTLTGGGTGTAALANYQAALQSITFSSASASLVSRTVSFVVSDGSLTSNTATRRSTYRRRPKSRESMFPAGPIGRRSSILTWRLMAWGAPRWVTP